MYIIFMKDVRKNSKKAIYPQTLVFYSYYIISSCSGWNIMQHNERLKPGLIKSVCLSNLKLDYPLFYDVNEYPELYTDYNRLCNAFKYQFDLVTKFYECYQDLINLVIPDKRKHALYQCNVALTVNNFQRKFSYGKKFEIYYQSCIQRTKTEILSICKSCVIYT